MGSQYGEAGFWNPVQAYGENLTDTRADLYSNYAQFIKADTVNRPRTMGVRFTYKVGP